jgi:hypothetical protein
MCIIPELIAMMTGFSIEDYLGSSTGSPGATE